MPSSRTPPPQRPSGFRGGASKHITESLPLLYSADGDPLAGASESAPPAAKKKSARAEALSKSGKVVKTRQQRLEARARTIDELHVIGQALNSVPMRPEDKAYIPSFLIYAALPYDDQGSLDLWTRRGGNYVVTFEAGYTDPTDAKTYRRVGLPYGIVPRRFFSYVASRIVRSANPSPVIDPQGASFSDFIREVFNVEPTGGPEGSITRIREQITRILALKITSSTVQRVHDNGRERLLNVNYRLVPVAGDAAFWDPLRPELHQDSIPTFRVSDDFFRQCLEFGVPFNEKVELELAKRNSCMGIDLYRILTLTQFHLYKSQARVPELLTWDELAGILGQNCKRRKHFRDSVANALQLVLPLYPDACAEARHGGLLIRPGSPHVTPKPKRLRAPATRQLPAPTPPSSPDAAPAAPTTIVGAGNT